MAWSWSSITAHTMQRHPDICQIDEELIRVALKAQVAKEACLLTGDPACKFVLTSDEYTLPL